MNFKCPCCNNELPIKNEFLGCKIRCAICHSKFKLHVDQSVELIFRSKRSYLGPQVTRNIIAEDELAKMEAEESFAAVFLEEEPENVVPEKTAPKLSQPPRRLKPGESAFSWTPMIIFLVALGAIPVSVYIFRPDLLAPLEQTVSNLKEDSGSKTVATKAVVTTDGAKANPAQQHLVSLWQSFSKNHTVHPSELALQTEAINKLVLEYTNMDRDYSFKRKVQMERSNFKAP